MAVLLLALAGCGGSGSASTKPTGPYAADIKSAQEKAPSKYQQEILADGKITRAEYEDAVDKYVACMRSHGVDVSKSLTPGGIYQYAQVGSAAESNKWIFICTNEYTGYVAGLYEDMLRNPQNLNENDLMAQCLVRLHVAPAGYTGAEYAKDNANSFKGSKVSPDDPQFNVCLDNPSVQ